MHLAIFFMCACSLVHNYLFCLDCSKTLAHNETDLSLDVLATSGCLISN